MKIGICDCEIIGKKKHRFPNLASMKISGYYKKKGFEVSLITQYYNLSSFDHVFLSKVFTNTVVPEWVLELDNVTYGGTGFFYDKATPLENEIEHTFPDYHLYDDWIKECIDNGAKEKQFDYYKNYSIGFLTRGCFRKCEFCVNKNYNKCLAHSHIKEFLKEDRPKICFLDDNFFACKSWKDLIKDVKQTNKKFQFKQGLDERLLTKDIVEEMLTWKYDGKWIFAFDNVEDKNIIRSKLELLPQKIAKQSKFYVLCGYDKENKYDLDFWLNDIRNVFKRCFILAQYGALPYLMRFEKVYDSEFSKLYSVIAAWCNQPSIYNKFSFALYAICSGMNSKGYSTYKRDVQGYLNSGGKKGASWRYYEEFIEKYGDRDYFYITPEDLMIKN